MINFKLAFSLTSFTFIRRLFKVSFKKQNREQLQEIESSSEWVCQGYCFGKGRGTRNQIVNIHWIIEKAREFQKNFYFCFIDYAKAFDCMDHNKLWRILKEMGIPDHLTCLLRNLYAGQEATGMELSIPST